MYNQQTIAAKIRGKRAEKGVSQAQLAEVLGVSRTTVGTWESGEVQPGMNKVWELADYYGCTIDELVGREVPMQS